MTGRHAHTLLLVASLVATLSGCTSIELALGLRTRLDSVPVSSLSASLSLGHDGSLGSPGAAGTILVSVDPEADVYLDHLRLSNKDGDGRQGPAAVVRVEPVPALW